jgi:hypothetical protein
MNEIKTTLKSHSDIIESTLNIFYKINAVGIMIVLQQIQTRKYIKELNKSIKMQLVWQ